MARVISTINSAIIRLIASFGLILMITSGVVRAQNPYDTGTPVEARGGASWFSAYAPDKLENVNLANGNFMVNIPLATVGGRGSASYTVALSYHGKLWTSRHNPEVVTDPLGGSIIFHHFQPDYSDGVETLPNSITLGGGWFILKAPAIKTKTFGIDARRTLPNPGWYHYVLTKYWLTLPDGSEIELRDEATQGAPAQGVLPPNPPLTDRDRGRVWKSVDGSAITYIKDSSTLFSGWVFMPDGTRFSIDNTARCTKIIDRNGNTINIAYDTPATGDVTYTDQLGRQVILQGGTAGATVTVKGYNGLADRVYTVDTDRIGALDGSGNPTNMRSDYWSVQRPIIAGDYLQAYSGTIEHTYPGPHTDLFYHGEYGIVIDDIVTPTKLTMPDGRLFTFRYNKYALLAEIVYPGGGKTQIDYSGGPSDVCEILNSPFAADVNRKVTQRRTLSNGTTVDAVWLYNIGYDISPTSSFEVRQGSAIGPLLMAETHYFMALNAEYRRCYSFGNDLLDYGSDGTMNPKWENAKINKIERQTGSGLLTEMKNWTQRTPVVWAPDPGSGTNAYSVQYGQEQPSNDDRVTREDSILENGKLKRVEFGYDNFNNVTSVKEYDFGNDPDPGALVRETIRSYATNLNGSCYSNLNPSDTGCGGGIAADINSIVHLRRLLLQESVWDRTTNDEKARTTYEYDVYANDNNHANLISYGAVSGHDAIWGTVPLRATRGNVTRVGNWLKASNTYLYTYPRFDEVGNVVATKDPRGNVSSVSFADDFGTGDDPGSGEDGNFGATYAFPTLFTSPPPNPGGESHTARAQYDFSRGTQTGFKDRNNSITKVEYNDPFNRPTKTISAKGVAGVEAHTSFYYAPNNVYGITLNSNDVMVVKDRDAAGDAILRSWTLTDGFGRTTEDWTRHPQGDVKVSTIYDPLGRVKQTSNPYRSAETPIYTTTTYDLAGRVTAVTTPGGATVSTAYDGERVMVTDPAQKKRISETDALGRLLKVWEIKPEDSATVSITFPQSGETIYHGYLTQYAFDVLDNLTNVAQGAQTRTFTYDSLKRLKSATNPENGLITYVYDENGNLKEKTDARGITATFNYDALNRLTSDSYTSYPNGSAGSVFVYDNPDPSKNGKGRLWHNYSYTTLPTGELKYPYNYIDAYDALGRPTAKTQKFLTRDCVGCSYYTKDYAITRTYDRAGNVKSQTYPSGRTVNYSYDIAGRLSEFKGKLGGTPSDIFYAKDIRYNARGQMTREEFGVNPGGHHTALYHRMYYNRRGQMFDTRLGTDSSSVWDVEDPLVWRWENGTWNRGAIRLFYSASFNDYNSVNPSQPDNNGNIYGMDHFVPNALDGSGNVTSWVMGSDGYVYDELNRLTQVTETPTGGSGPGFTQKYIYDRWGNRKIDTAATSNVGGGVTDIDFQVNTANNRLLAPTDTGTPGDKMRYDEVGNLIHDEYSNPTNPSRDFGYDVNNRIGVVKNSSGVELARYLYDPDGRRVRRTVGVMETWLVYGFDSELIAEYAYNVGASNPQKEYGHRDGNLMVVWDATETGNRQWQWLVSDHLGSPRMVVDRGGEATGIRRRDFLPFGEELASGIGHRNAAGAGYIADNIRQRFTGKQRDSETGLDFSETRYLSNPQGRFTSPDDPTAGQNADDPQNWNLYTYALNNPLKYVDPDGRWPFIIPPMGLITRDMLERMRNKVSGYGFRTDAQVRAEIERRRAFLREQEKNLAIRNAQGQFRRVDVSNLSDRQVWTYYDQIQNGVIEQLSKEQSEKIKELFENVQVPGTEEFKKPKSGVSGKEGAKDIPSWAEGQRPKVGEDGAAFAKRLLDEQYGIGNWKKGPGSEYSKLQKYADRSFE